MVRYSNIPIIGQTYAYGCWIASYQMLQSYKTGTTSAAQPTCSDSWKGPNGGLNTDPTTLGEYAAANGLSFTNGPTFAAVKGMIGNGPIMCVGVFPGLGTHFYVVGGMDNDQPFANTAFDLYDPMPIGSGKISQNLSIKDFLTQYPQCCQATFQLQ